MVPSNVRAAKNHSANRPSSKAAMKFSTLSIAVICERDTEGDRLIRILQKTRASVTHIWPVPEQIPADYDVVYCALIPDLPQRLPWLPGMAGAALTVILPQNASVDLTLLRNSAPHSVLHWPATDASVEVSLMMAREHYGYECRLNARIEKLDDNLRTMRAVERAKAILMKHRGMAEDEAYHYLRMQSMTKRVSIGALSTAIIDFARAHRLAFLSKYFSVTAMKP